MRPHRRPPPSDGRSIAAGWSSSACRSACSCWPRSSGCPIWRHAARGTRTRATTCWSCEPSCATASSRCSARRPRSATSTTARCTTTCCPPAALLTGGDSPLAVVALIALAGIAAVLVTWWLARDIGGPVAGLVAGLAMAVSASAVDESTFIWNPNLIALSSAIALAGAWRAWTTRRSALVAARRRRHGDHDAMPRAGRHAPADRRRPPRRGRAESRAGQRAAAGLAVRAGGPRRSWR